MNISEKIDAYLEKTFPDAQTAIYRDLSLNLKKIMEESPLDPQDRFTNWLSIAVSLGNAEMVQAAKQTLQQMDVSPEVIQESAEIAGLMGMMNTYYKFKGFLSEEAKPNFTRAGLRMNSMSKPLSGKDKFEMMSFSVSVVNGCPACVASHERALTQLGVEADKIHDLARLAAVCKALDSFQSARKLL